MQIDDPNAESEESTRQAAGALWGIILAAQNSGEFDRACGNYFTSVQHPLKNLGWFFYHDADLRRKSINALQNMKDEYANPILSKFLSDCTSARSAWLSIPLILDMPRQWVLDRVERVAEPILRNGDFQDFGQLIFLYHRLDPALANKLAMRAAAHVDPDIRERGEWYINQRPHDWGIS